MPVQFSDFSYAGPPYYGVQLQRLQFRTTELYNWTPNTLNQHFAPDRQQGHLTSRGYWDTGPSRFTFLYDVTLDAVDRVVVEVTTELVGLDQINDAVLFFLYDQLQTEWPQMQCTDSTLMFQAFLTEPVWPPPDDRLLLLPATAAQRTETQGQPQKDTPPAWFFVLVAALLVAWLSRNCAALSTPSNLVNVAFSGSTATPLPARIDCKLGCLNRPDNVCGPTPIKGYIAPDGTKWYILGTNPNYETVQLDINRGDRWFCTEDEAVSNQFEFHP